MKKIIIPIVFALAGTSFVAYSFLDTFVIPKEYKGAFNANHGASQFSFSFANMDNSSSSSTASSSSTSSSSKSSSKSSSSSMKSSSSSSNSVASSSSSGSSYSAPIWPEENISTSQYYENLTPEQIASLFTPEVVFVPKKHYSDPDIYIEITTEHFEQTETLSNQYYAADIRIRNTGLLKTALANDVAGENINEFTSEICKRHKGILAIDGDTYGAQKSGYVLRNGQIIRSSRNLKRRPRSEDLAIYADGTFEVFNEADYTLEQVASRGAWQVFSFGPGLIQDGKKIIQKGEEVGTAAGGYMNQRCAIGMIAPLHYIFVVSDGRMKSSPGLSLYQIGKIMEAKHAWCAYNLDGGGSATMYMDDGTGNQNGNGALVNYCTQELVGNNGNNLPEYPELGERGVSDIVYIGKE